MFAVGAVGCEARASVSCVGGIRMRDRHYVGDGCDKPHGKLPKHTKMDLLYFLIVFFLSFLLLTVMFMFFILLGSGKLR